MAKMAKNGCGFVVVVVGILILFARPKRGKMKKGISIIKFSGSGACPNNSQIAQKWPKMAKNGQKWPKMVGGFVVVVVKILILFA